jgi:hypothetical protein
MYTGLALHFAYKNPENFSEFGAALAAGPLAATALQINFARRYCEIPDLTGPEIPSWTEKSLS